MNIHSINVPAMLVTSGYVTKVHGGTLMSKSISLSRGKVALVDDADYEWLNQYKWFYNNGYAGRRTSRLLGKQTTITMHRTIMQPPQDTVIDHINGDGLDNRRANLRVCNTSQNAMNLKTPEDNTSGYKGVSWHKKSGKWQAKIGINKKIIYLGTFDNAIDAARAYNIAASEYFGNFARLNELP